MNTSESDNSRTMVGEPGSDLEAMRGELRAMASASGYHSTALVEWCSADAPGAPADLPPLYYAALLPGDRAADMPLGLGETPTAALTDLLWTLGGPALFAALRMRDHASDVPSTARQSSCVAEMDARGEAH